MSIRGNRSIVAVLIQVVAVSVAGCQSEKPRKYSLSEKVASCSFYAKHTNGHESEDSQRAIDATCRKLGKAGKLTGRGEVNIKVACQRKSETIHGVSRLRERCTATPRPGRAHSTVQERADWSLDDASRAQAASFSSDKDSLAFAKDENGVFLATAPDWTPRRIHKFDFTRSVEGGSGFGEQLEWSPSGKSFFVIQRGEAFISRPSEAIVMDVTGKILRTVVGMAGGSWHSDDELIYVAEGGLVVRSLNKKDSVRTIYEVQDENLSIPQAGVTPDRRTAYALVETWTPSGNMYDFLHHLVATEVEKGRLLARSSQIPCRGHLNLQLSGSKLVGLCQSSQGIMFLELNRKLKLVAHRELSFPLEDGRSANTHELYPQTWGDESFIVHSSNRAWSIDDKGTVRAMSPRPSLADLRKRGFPGG